MWSYGGGADSSTRVTSEEDTRLCEQTGAEFVPP
jgi:hypothetical protein